MSTFSLKFLAFLIMLVDHIGFLFFPDRVEFRIVGRLAMPLFAFLVAQGYLKTKNLSFYLFRLLFFALLTQPIYYVFLNEGDFPFQQLNILFTFLFSLLLLDLFESQSQWFIFLVFAVTVLSGFRLLEYGLYGIFNVVYFYYLSKNRINFVFIFIFILIQIWGLFETLSIIQPVSILSLFFIALYNNRRGLDDRKLFYWLYPLHLFSFLLFKGG
ncbi:TraX family protein [Spirulina sp. 06S082]|uniref:TraX family protein n=1 Tax=Spirulina sp. 06S082 TaxID=3110248 RepID=UPI002B213516|nr:TraX family protein [Spirulina sp. 06S082]MEA5472154.1 TraX family protein [Spirulina sp. 06S082]